MRPVGRSGVVFIALLTVSLAALVAAAALPMYHFWSPGLVVTDGRHDLGGNGIWIAHGWLGDDAWFSRAKRNPTLYRDKSRIAGLRARLDGADILDVFPHLCPCAVDGTIPGVDEAQTTQFLAEMGSFRVLPWIGGVVGKQVFLGSPQWRNTFIRSAVDLLKAFPNLAGIHVNIEPVPTGSPDFLKLLRELRRVLPEGMMLSVAAYPPPTMLHPFSQVHWERDFFEAVCREADQVVVMMYDTAIKFEKFYTYLMAEWTGEILHWAGTTDILLGVPVYHDAHVPYHDPKVENLKNALAGIHRGLSQFKKLPVSYRGIAIYSEWEMDPSEWDYLRRNFVRPERP
jgi:hypothetical protein